MYEYKFNLHGSGVKPRVQPLMKPKKIESIIMSNIIIFPNSLTHQLNELNDILDIKYEAYELREGIVDKVKVKAEQIRQNLIYIQNAHEEYDIAIPDLDIEESA